MTIPKRRATFDASVSRQGSAGGADNLHGIPSHELIGAMFDGCGPLGVFAQGETRYTQHGRLLLDPTRIGEDDPRAVAQRQKIQITKRFQGHNARCRLVCWTGEHPG